jgi:putative flippase GtrA
MFALLWLALNLWIMYVCVDYFHVYYMYSAVVAKWIVFFRNYSMNKWFNFS